MSWGSDDDQRGGFDRDRQALADLLAARGHHEAAAITAACEYCTEWNDTIGDGLCVRLAVPPALYDRARTDLKDVIDEACIDIVGDQSYSGVRFAVRRSPVRPGLVEEIIMAFGGPRWVSSERVNRLPVPTSGAQRRGTGLSGDVHRSTIVTLGIRAESQACRQGD